MQGRKKIGVYIDYALRSPNFIGAYNLFKSSLFKTTEEYVTEETSDVEAQDDNMGIDVTRFYWKQQLSDPNCEDFYIKSFIKEGTDNYDLRDWRKYFYTDEHYKKFLEEFTFNLYADAEAPCKKDIEFLNIAQSHLFDVILIDEYIVTRKKLNTMYFLSKVRVMPQAVIFLGPGQNIAEETYFGIWNPKKNSDQENREGEGGFEMWLKELESKNNG
jgi:hypothetical protein